MESILTHTSIAEIGKQVDSYYELHPTSIAFIISLIKPYYDALETVDPKTESESLKEWFSMAFPGKLAEHALVEYNKAFSKGKDPRLATLEYIVAEILDQGKKETDDEIVLPWHISKGISLDEELSTMFKAVIQDPKLLPVDVTVGDKTYQHNLSQDFTAGLLLFSLLIGNKSNYVVSMFGTVFDKEFMRYKDASFYNLQGEQMVGDDNFYIIAIKNYPFINQKEAELWSGSHISYTFPTLDFLTGFKTGALWTGIDYNQYYSYISDGVKTFTM